MKKKIRQFWFNFVYNVGFMALLIALFYITLHVSAETCMRLLVVTSLATAPGCLLSTFLYWGRMSKKNLWMRRIIVIITSSAAYGLFYIMFGLMKLDSITAYLIYGSAFLSGSLAQFVVYLISDHKEKRSIEKINQKLLENQNN